MDQDLIPKALRRSQVALFELDRELKFVWGVFPHLRKSPRAYAGKRNADLLPADLAARADELMRSVLDSGKRTRLDLVVPGPDGALMLDVYVDRICDDSGSPVGVSCAAIDVTGRARVADRLAASSRLATIGSLASGLVHELSNPLTYLMGNLRMVMASMQRHDASSPRHRRMLDQLSQSLEGAVRIERVVRDLRACIRGASNAQVITLQQALESACRIAAHEVKRYATLQVEWGPSPPVNASPVRLAQVAINLLLNAAQSMVRSAGEEKEVRLSTFTLPDGRACFSVRDTGSGIAWEHRERLFMPFFSTHAPDEAGGLGLWACRNVVAELGGQITIASQAGRGTEVRVELPAAQCTAGPASEPRSTVSTLE